jgi:chorismate mutase
MDTLQVGFSSYARILQLAQQRQKLVEQVAEIDREMDVLAYPGDVRVAEIKDQALKLASVQDVEEYK